MAEEAITASKKQLREQPDSAYFYANKAFAFAQKTGNKKLLSQANIAISESLFQLGKKKQSITFAQQGLTIAQQHNDDKNILDAVLLLGNGYASQLDFSKAVKIYSFGFKHFSNPKKLYELSAVNSAFGGLYRMMGKNDLSEQFYKDNIHNNSIPENNGGAAKAHYEYARFFTSRKFYEKAIPEYLDAIRLFKMDAATTPDKIEAIALELSDCYLKTGNIQKADEYRNFNKEKIKSDPPVAHKSAGKKAKKTVAKTVRQIPTQPVMNATSVPNPKNKPEMFIAFLLVFLALMASAVLRLLYRNKVLREENRNAMGNLKSHLFANLSNEFNLPLNRIGNSIQSIKTEDIHKPEIVQIESNTESMSRISQQLLMLSKINNGQQKLALENGNLSEYLQETIAPFIALAQKQSTGFITNIEKTNGADYFDRNLIDNIISDLLSHAFEYADGKETVYFSATIEKNKLQLRISSSGNDLRQEDLRGLFGRFYEKNDSQDKPILRFAFVKELVKLHNGSIDASLDGQTLRFFVSLPLDKNA